MSDPRPDERTSFFQRLYRNDWFRAFVLALLLLIVMHIFVVRWVIVESTSMFATLRPGDLVLVERWPLWTGLSRGDVVVFRDPLKDDRSMMRRPLLVKRIIGMPGDRVELRKGKVVVNGESFADPKHGTQAYIVRLVEPEFSDSLLKFLGLPSYLVQRGRNTVEVPLNETLSDRVTELPYVRGADQMSSATNSPRHIFPFSPRYPWNGDEYGPISVPAKGDTLRITVDNLPLYDRLITAYEGHKLGASKNVLQLDGTPFTEYIVEQDHYFVLGDSRHHSSDSRYWGFVPADHITGKAGLLLWGKGVDGTRSGRDWTPL